MGLTRLAMFPRRAASLLPLVYSLYVRYGVRVRKPTTAAVDAINSRYGRTLIGYGQCGDPGGYVGAKIAYGRIPELEDFQ